jgi:hypothetical protein
MHEEYAAHGSRSAPRSFPLIVVAVLACTCLISLVISGVALHRTDQANVPAPTSGALTLHLLPGTDLLTGIMDAVRARQLRSAWVVSCVGSLTQYAIRFANENNITVGPVAHFEIVSLVGTMTALTARNISSAAAGAVLGGPGGWHLHIAVSDSRGVTIGGHLAREHNSTLYTTAEVVIGFDCNVEYFRAVDGSTPWDELQIVQTSWC